MAILSSTNLISMLCTFHLWIAYTLVAAPSRLLNQNLIFTLGTAMQIPQLSAIEHLPPEIGHPASFGNPLNLPGNPALSLASVFLAFLVVSDLAALSMREDVYIAFWTAQAPIRLGALFALEGWIYLYKPAFGEVETGWAKGLKTDLVFTWAFMEMLFTFWIFLAVRDERTAAVTKAKEASEKTRTD